MRDKTTYADFKAIQTLLVLDGQLTIPKMLSPFEFKGEKKRERASLKHFLSLRPCQSLNSVLPCPTQPHNPPPQIANLRRKQGERMCMCDKEREKTEQARKKKNEKGESTYLEFSQHALYLKSTAHTRPRPKSTIR